MNRMKQSKSTLRRAALALLCVAVILPFLAPAPEAGAQVSFNVQIGAPPPVCPYGYYDYAPYACAPMGYYGPGYFYNGIFIGVGPWAYWGYRHGWGPNRFYGPGGGRYLYYPDHRRPWAYREYYYRPGYFHDDGGWHRGHAYGHYKHDDRYDRGWRGDRGDHGDHGDYDRGDHGDRGHGDHGDHGDGHGHGHDR